MTRLAFCVRKHGPAYPIDDNSNRPSYWEFSVATGVHWIAEAPREGECVQA